MSNINRCHGLTLILAPFSGLQHLLFCSSYILYHPSGMNLTFMGLCFVNIFQYISNKMQLYTAYLYPETALLVSGGTSTQELIHLYLQHLVCVTPLTATCRYSTR